MRAHEEEYSKRKNIINIGITESSREDLTNINKVEEEMVVELHK